jgi:hypothetical protein
MEDVKLQIEKLSPQRGELVLVTVPRMPSYALPEVVARLRKQLKAILPEGVQVLIQEEGVRCSVIDRKSLGIAVDAWRLEDETPEERAQRMRSLPGGFDYDPLNRVLTILGIKYSEAVFRELAFAPIGSMLRIVGREDGRVDVERLTFIEGQEAPFSVHVHDPKSFFDMIENNPRQDAPPAEAVKEILASVTDSGKAEG